MKNIKRRSDCPTSFALDIFGDKWTLLIVRDILFRGKKTYGDFLNSEEGIATNILADRLELLEQANIIQKTADKLDSRKNIYSLTQKGEDLLPLFLEITLWSAKYDPKTGAPKEFVQWLKKDKKGFIKYIKECLRKGETLVNEK